MEKTERQQQDSSLSVAEQMFGRQKLNESLSGAEQLFDRLSIQSTWLDECK